MAAILPESMDLCPSLPLSLLPSVPSLPPTPQREKAQRLPRPREQERIRRSRQGGEGTISDQQLDARARSSSSSSHEAPDALAVQAHLEGGREGGRREG
jgi:hypothetical protein